MTATFALLLSAFAIVQIIALRATVYALEARHDARLKALENRNREQTGKTGQVPKRPEYIGGSKMPEPKEWNRQEVSITKDEPKPGTVAAKAAKPVVFLGHVPHRAIELDNGCLEWEGKI